jgi:hypothetical protein
MPGQEEKNMPRTRRSWQAISIGSELVAIGIWILVEAGPRDDLSKNLNNNLFLYLSLIWLAFALIHGYVSYRSLKNAPSVWYKEWNLFWGLADACLSGFLWLLALTPEQSSALGWTFFLGLFLLLFWILLMFWAVFVVIKYPNLQR